MYPEIGSFDAKTQLSRLLREVERGRRYTITLRGRPVADLIPSGSALRVEAAAAVAAMRAARRVRGVGSEELAAWVADGRR